MAFPVDNTLFNLTGRFGPRAPISLPNGGKSSNFHGGDDLAPETKGKTELVYAVGKGRIHSVGRKRDAGIFVILTLQSGFRVRYCHLSTYGVRGGQDVEDGQILGRVGSTGNSTGVHLHIEVYPPDSLSKRLDPRPFYWNEWNPGRPKAQAPSTPAPAPRPTPAPAPAPAVVRVGSKIKLSTSWSAYRTAELLPRQKIGSLPAGTYEVRGIVNGNLHLKGNGTSGWVHRSAQAGLVK